MKFLDGMDLGAFGSVMEGPLPDGNKGAFQFVKDAISDKALNDLLDRLPPYYRDFVGVRPIKMKPN